MKTQNELKKEWGIERFVKALNILSNWYLGKQHPINQKQMMELKEKSEDAFKLFGVRLLEKE